MPPFSLAEFTIHRVLEGPWIFFYFFRVWKMVENEKVLYLSVVSYVVITLASNIQQTAFVHMYLKNYSDWHYCEFIILENFKKFVKNPEITFSKIHWVVGTVQSHLDSTVTTFLTIWYASFSWSDVCQLWRCVHACTCMKGLKVNENYCITRQTWIPVLSIHNDCIRKSIWAQYLHAADSLVLHKDMSDLRSPGSIFTVFFIRSAPCVSGVEIIDSLHFLAGCRTRRIN